ncbi:hypothetical protein J5N97_018252 [Dioscorea zingiberensis]|uniref:soluble epoxide hydrolase n=1 Tax=Dioscorea zingiberensis TaxID=325984 RepID=A0A9D5CPV6_9LILI|nr:hypothetical protein J5N97_018252 [Dioscorea zingiberensis]
MTWKPQTEKPERVREGERGEEEEEEEEKEMEMEGINHRRVEVNGIGMHVAEKGEGGPVVLMLHGFPELWYSWRHQIIGLAAKGYHAVAPDLRGYGDTDTPSAISAYSIFHLVGDLVALIDVLGQEQVFVVGHDWGAHVAWNLCMFRPDKVKALVNLSVPFMGRNPAANPVDYFRSLYGESYYICRFQEPGVIEADFANVTTKQIFKKFLMSFCDPGGLFMPKEGWVLPDEEIPLPAWFSEEDVNYFSNKFEKTGFTGPINYYRCFNSDWELLAPWTGAQVKVPTKFIVGDLDLTYHYPGIQDFIHKGGFKQAVPFLQDVILGLVARGYHAVAPDLRGFGDTDIPPSASSYTMLHLVGDILALINALGQDKVFVVGHDWGAVVAWHLCMLRPEKFQEPGAAEAEFAKIGSALILKKFLTTREPNAYIVPKETGFSAPSDEEITLPPWLSEEDIDYYAAKFEKTGFTGGLNYYRCMDLNWELTAPCVQDYIHKGGFKKDVPFLEDVVVMEGVGHFITLEKAHEITHHIMNISIARLDNTLPVIHSKSKLLSLRRRVGSRREMDEIEHRTVEVNGINMHIAEKGKGGSVVLLLHGFPELWYSWRHQIIGLAAHGYHAVAPDLRGFGDTTAPPDINSYSIFHLVGDLVALIDLLGQEQVFVVGHDWGAIIAWHLCMFRPDKVKALVSLSVPFMPRHPSVKPIQSFRALLGDDFYICRFQEPGAAEARYASIDTALMLKKVLTSRDTNPGKIPKKGSEVFDVPEIILPPWLTEEDIGYFASKFKKTGFTGGLNYYRNLDKNWELKAAWQEVQIQVPVKYIVGDVDLTYHLPGMQDYIHKGGFKKDVPLLEDVVIMEGVAHFINQEKPIEVTEHIYEFLNKF